MADYSPNEIVDMVIVLREWHNNYNAAARLYAEHFRDRRRREYNEDDARVVTILAVIHLDPHVSSRQVEREVGIPRRTFLKVPN
ncbi:hypothetical protein TSAR_014600 [Trichomalopsis sarcophagae]|uniref:DUF4817 domain-containing protein n=1 Tax=Trichomalopsis sarcophagae TaxID=543379 RepID=A0A232EMA6_9HYME|nr:hypothetical protein TSAR_014600 [Trichomalopsis sarcophagae]